MFLNHMLLKIKITLLSIKTINNDSYVCIYKCSNNINVHITFKINKLMWYLNVLTKWLVI